MYKKSAILLLALLLPIVALLAALLISPNWFSGVASHSVHRFTGFELQIASLQTRRDPLRLEIHGLRLLNPEWPEPLLASVDQLSLQLIDLPLRQRPFWAVAGEGIELRLAQDEAGHINWLSSQLAAGSDNGVAAPSTQDSAPAMLPADFSFEHIRLQRLGLIWHRGEQQTRVAIPNLDIRRTAEQNSRGEFDLHIDEEVFRIGADLQLAEAGSAALSYRIDLSHPELRLASAGLLSLQPNLAGTALSLQTELDSLAPFSRLLQLELPALQGLALQTQLQVNEHIELRELLLRANGNELRGSADLQPQRGQFSAELNAKSLDLDALLAAFSTSNDTDGKPGTDTDTNTDKTTGNNSAPAAEAELDWAVLQQYGGRLALTAEQLKVAGWQADGLTLQLHAGEELRLSLRSEQLASADAGMSWPQLDVAARVQPLQTRTQGADLDFDLNIHARQVLQAEASGRANINGLGGTQVALSARSTRTAPLWQALGLPWTEAGALELRGKLQTSDTQLEPQLEIKLGQQQLRSELRYLLGERPQLRGRIDGERLSLGFLQAPAAPEAAAATAKKTTSPAAKASRLLSTEPIDFAPLQSLDADIQLNLAGVDTGFNQLTSLQLAPKLRNGRLQLQGGRAEFASGTATLDLNLNSRAKLPELALALQLDSSDFGALGLERAANISGGNGSANITLNSRGRSAQALGAALNGNIDLQVADMVLNNASLDLIGSDLFSETFQALNPFAKQDPNTHFECIAVHVDVRNGLLSSDQQLSVETSKMKIIGTGEVNLHDESLSLSFTPIARKGLGVNLGDVVKLVRVGGTLAAPRLVADAGGVASAALSTGAAVYTGGLSILAEKLIQRAVHNGSACNPDAAPVEYDIPLLPSEAPPPEGSGSPGPGDSKPNRDAAEDGDRANAP